MFSLTGIMMLIYTSDISFSIDEIYEDGISSYSHTFKDYVKKNTFHYYEDIKKISHGEYLDKKDGRKWRFLILYTINLNKPTTLFNEKNYTNNFFNELLDVLRSKCLYAEWVPGKWEDRPIYLSK